MSFFELSILDCCVLISIISFAMLRFAAVIVEYLSSLLIVSSCQSSFGASFGLISV